MKQCRKCGVNVDDDLANCPLCGAFASEVTSPTIYEYPAVNIKKHRRLFLKISLFITVFTYQRETKHHVRRPRYFFVDS